MQYRYIGSFEALCPFQGDANAEVGEQVNVFGQAIYPRTEYLGSADTLDKQKFDPLTSILSLVSCLLSHTNGVYP